VAHTTWRVNRGAVAQLIAALASLLAIGAAWAMALGSS
jgi:hypothetical protein